MRRAGNCAQCVTSHLHSTCPSALAMQARDMCWNQAKAEI
jgi:hypothetical protein